MERLPATALVVGGSGAALCRLPVKLLFRREKREGAWIRCALLFVSRMSGLPQSFPTRLFQKYQNPYVRTAPRTYNGLR